jgi:hypothetical protein
LIFTLIKLNKINHTESFFGTYIHITPIDFIIQELNENGFTARQVVNVKNKITKLPLPLFFIDLESDQNNKEIFKLTSICYTKIKVEEPHLRRQIIQCLRCQDFGHSRTYCNHALRCVKCGENHNTSACLKPIDEPPKFALCEGQHPASYRGNIVYKNVQQRHQKKK